jgi:2',3'-cyclic-nucleotide 2'-phosphodiesterase (5'-nucleotidase family)
MHWLKVTSTALALLGFLLAGSAWADDSKLVELKILHVNDFHGRMLPFVAKGSGDSTEVGGAAFLARKIEEERSKNPDGVILLSAGDMFQGVPISNVFRGKPVLEMMNILRFDAMAVGNHEFDWGLEVLGQMTSEADFPFLSANIVDEGKALPWLKPFIIIDRKGVRIAIVGVTTVETPFATKPANVADLQFLQPNRVLPKLIQEIRADGADLVIVLSHLGLEADKSLAGAVPGIDIIVGGHSHTVVTDPVRVGNTLIVQAGYWGVYLGILDFKVDKSARGITTLTPKYRLETVHAGTGRPIHEPIARITERYHEKIREEFSKQVGETRVDLIRRAGKESNVGNLVADSMRSASGSDIAFQNNGGIRSDIPKGPVTLEHVYTLLPFDNLVISMELSGRQVLQLLKESGSKHRGILQVSGLRVEYGPSRRGARNVRKAILTGGKSLDPNSSYRVAVNDFLAAGGDGYEILKKGRNVVSGDGVREAFIDYLARHSPVNPQIEGRIKFDR